ncbi:hypothetical protein PM082_018931 [Marasmius tenuissimus]|nr:hypothetical protein PM082_018931 [Marasmius tenuissimus]
MLMVLKGTDHEEVCRGTDSGKHSVYNSRRHISPGSDNHIGFPIHCTTWKVRRGTTGRYRRTTDVDHISTMSLRQSRGFCVEQRDVELTRQTSGP